MCATLGTFIATFAQTFHNALATKSMLTFRDNVGIVDCVEADGAFEDITVDRVEFLKC